MIGITIVLPIGESVVKDVFRIGMKVRKEEKTVIRTEIVMTDVKKDVEKEVSVGKESVGRDFVENVGITEREIIVGNVFPIVRQRKSLSVGKRAEELQKACIVRKNKLSIVKRTRTRRQNYA